VTAGAALAAMPRGTRVLLLLPLWFVGYYLAGSASAVRYVPPILQPRYFIPCLPFLTVALAGAAVSVWSRLKAGPLRGASPRAERAALLGALALPLLFLPAADRAAGRAYGAVLAGNARGLVTHWSMFGREPLVLSAALSVHVHPLFDGRRPPDLLYSHEVDPERLARLARAGGFFFAELDRRSWLFRESENPMIQWRYSLLPASERHADGLVHDAVWRGRSPDEWVVREVARFHGFRSRIADLASVLGRPATEEQLLRDEAQTVVLYRCVPAPRDALLAHRLPPLDERDLRPPRNAGFSDWEGDVPRGWQVVGGPSRRGGGDAEGQAAVLGPCGFCYLWQSLPAGPTLAGRTLELSARARARRGGTARLWIKLDVGGEWEELFSPWHPGDGEWRRLAVRLPVPIEFRGGELRVALQHWNDRSSSSSFDEVRLAAEP
jgi:hypothetical protein